jgi:hypothetical protein
VKKGYAMLHDLVSDEKIAYVGKSSLLFIKVC